MAKEPVRFVFDQASFRSCHASTVLPLPGGGCLVAWFGGHREGDDGVCVWGARSPGAGVEFSAPYVLASAGPAPHWNPVLFRSRDGEVLLFFKYGRVISTWRTWVAASTDGGASFGKPRELVPGPDGEGGRGPVKNKVLVTDPGGEWVAGSSDERGQWFAYSDISCDGGHTWEASAPVAPGPTVPRGTGVIQPSLWQSAPGQVHMLLRSDCGHICRADSADGGRTWGSMYKMPLPNNNSGVDVCRLGDGRLLLAYNPTSGSWAPRSPLRLSLSEDNGATWPLSVDIASGEGEYSYPACVASELGAEVTFTWKRCRIAHVSLAPGDLRSREQGGCFDPTPSNAEGAAKAPTYSLDHFVNTVGER